MSGGSVLVRASVDQTEGDGSTPIPPLQLRVYPISKAAAKPFITERHYLHRMPNPASLCFGVFAADMDCVGALVFGYPAARMEDNTGSTYELRRYWLSDRCAPNSESRVLGYCIRWIRANRPAVRRLISYSDLSMGHTGIIYKATGWRVIATVKGAPWARIGQPKHKRSPLVMGDKLKWELAL